MIETWFNQDMKKAVKVQYLDGNIFSADNNGNKVGVVVTEDGEPVTLTGSISGVAVRADGGSVALEGGSDGNKAWVVLPQAAYAIPGICSIIIKNTIDTQVVTLCAVVAYVYIANTDEIVDPGEIIPSVEELLAAIDEAMASIPADYSSLWASLAPAFASGSYSVGDYVTYSGHLYRFTAAHSGSWNADHVVQVDIGSELRDRLVVNPTMAYLGQATTVLSDTNNARANSIYVFTCNSASQLPAHVPSGCPLEFQLWTIKTTFTSSDVAYTCYEQYIVDHNGLFAVYYRRYLNGWENWQDLNPLLSMNTQMAYLSGARNVLSDLNNARANTIYFFNCNNASQLPSNVPTNCPLEFYCLSLKTQFVSQSTTYDCIEQYIIDHDGISVMFHRRYVLNAWGTWAGTNPDISMNKKMAYLGGATDVLSDLNNARANTIYYFVCNSASQLPSHIPTNCPLEFFCLSLRTEFFTGGSWKEDIHQYILDPVTLRNLYHRVYIVDSWSAWGAVENSRQITVATDGTGMFTTVSAAVVAASDGDTVYVRKGTYDNEVVEAWGKDISIVGEDKYETIIKNGYNDYSRPPLEMDIGSLSNLTLYAYDGGGSPGQYGYAYGLHIEHNSMANKTFHAYEVVFKSDKNTGAGIGMRPGSYSWFENCEFWSKEQGGIFYHDCATGAVGVQNISFTNCVFMTVQGDCSIRIDSQKFTGTTVYNRFIDCVVANASGTTPVVKAQHATQYTGDATGPIGDFYSLINFYHTTDSYGNNVAGLNYNETPSQITVYNGLDSTSATDALSANQGRVLNNGTVKNTGNETIAGAKTFESSVKTEGSFEFRGESTSSTFAKTATSGFEPSAGNYGAGRIQFVEYSPKSDGSALNGKYEAYRLPTVDTNKASNEIYYILTTKENAVVDNLNSTSATNVLSANQGKVLNDSKLGFTALSSTDLDTVLVSGLYGIVGNCTNSPTPRGSMEVIEYRRNSGDKYYVQIYYGYQYGEPKGIYYRVSAANATSWGSWIEVLTENNGSKGARTDWGKSLTASGFHQGNLLLNASYQYIVWFSSTNEIRVKPLYDGKTWTKSGTDSVSFGVDSTGTDFTITRSGNSITVTTTDNASIQLMYM